MNKRVLTTYQVARFCKVHHTTVINWVKEGILKAYTTPGGHRRIKKEDLLVFMKKYNIPMPELLMRKAKRVLVVEDDYDASEEYKEALSGNGFELDFAADGFEAGVQVYRRNPDLILLDFRMPGMDGFQVCEVLGRDMATAKIPIIAVTVLKSDKDVKKMKEHGIKKYFPKPVDPEELLKTIKKILSI